MVLQNSVNVMLSYQISCLQIWQSGIPKPLDNATSLLWFPVVKGTVQFFSTGMARNQRVISDKYIGKPTIMGKFLLKGILLLSKEDCFT